MPNQGIRERQRVLQEIKDLLIKKLEPFEVFQCPICSKTDGQHDIIMHILDQHTLKEIFESL